MIWQLSTVTYIINPLLHLPYCSCLLGDMHIFCFMRLWWNIMTCTVFQVSTEIKVMFSQACPVPALWEIYRHTNATYRRRNNRNTPWNWILTWIQKIAIKVISRSMWINPDFSKKKFFWQLRPFFGPGTLWWGPLSYKYFFLILFSYPRIIMSPTYC